jgi:hypothetical protein
MNTKTATFQFIRLSRQDSLAQSDQWEVKTYEVIDPLPTWIWHDGVPVCSHCKISSYRSAILTLRADGKTCSCNCGVRAMRELAS